MVNATLSKEMIENGASLVNQLDSQGNEIESAFWYYYPEDGSWKLLISSQDFDKAGPKSSYTKVLNATNKLQNHLVHLDDISIIKKDSPLLKSLSSVIRTSPGISGIRFSNNIINGELFNDVYIYRLNKSNPKKKYLLRKHKDRA